MRRSRFALVFAAGLWATAFLLIGCNQQSQPNPQQPTIANKICPIMKGKVDPTVQTVAFDGKTVGFCCEPCIAKFNRLSDAQKQTQLDEANRPKAKTPDEKQDDKNKKSAGAT